MSIVIPYIQIDRITSFPPFKLQYNTYKKLIEMDLNGKLCWMRIIGWNIMLVCNKNNEVIKLTDFRKAKPIVIETIKEQKYSYEILKIINTLYANYNVFKESSKNNELTFFIIHNSRPLFLKIITDKLKYNYKQIAKTIKIVSEIQSDAVQISIRIREKIIVYIQNKPIFSENKDKKQKEYVYYFVTQLPEFLTQIDDIISELTNKEILNATIFINSYNNYKIVEDENLKMSEDVKIAEGKNKTVYYTNERVILEANTNDNNLEVNVKYDLAPTSILKVKHIFNKDIRDSLKYLFLNNYMTYNYKGNELLKIKNSFYDPINNRFLSLLISTSECNKFQVRPTKDTIVAKDILESYVNTIIINELTP